MAVPASLASQLTLVTPQDIIWTDHASARARKRRIPQSAVMAVLHQAAKIYPGKQAKTYKVIGTYDERRLHVIVAPTDQEKWVVVTLWVRGEEDFSLSRVLLAGVKWMWRRIYS